MKMRKVISIALALSLLLVFSGCGSKGGGVYVQSVKTLAGYGGIAPGDRFGGIVVSENVAEIRKDGDKTIGELFVREGDDVTEGQELFTYDTDQLQLNLDKQKLELEQLLISIESYGEQIADLEKTRDRVYESQKLQYTIQIQSLQVDLKEAELKLKAKETEVAQSENILQNATVFAPVSGRVQSISENGTDNYGNPLPYISIQQSGSYRIKGVLGELQRGGIMEGDRIRITSRTDDTIFWLGTVSLVDYESPYQGSPNDMYYGTQSDEMTSSSRYPFYVELDNTEGLLLGQHVYMEKYVEGEVPAGITVGSAFICYAEDGSNYVWAENGGKLEMRTVVLGEYNMMLDAFEVLEGLTEDDYIAFPDPELCQPGAATTHDAPAPEETEGEVS